MIEIRHIDNEFPITDLAHSDWQNAEVVPVGTYSSGPIAPTERHFSARLLWSDTALYVRFEANQNEPLIVSKDPDVHGKTMGLWERDVCEIFLAPDMDWPNRYFEFEIAPTGEWLDLGIEIKDGSRITDQGYVSHMNAAAEILDGRVVMAIRLPFASLSANPRAGDVWVGNLFRCVGAGSTRGYLAWSPTLTETPNFHVPDRFGQLRFV